MTLYRLKQASMIKASRPCLSVTILWHLLCSRGKSLKAEWCKILSVVSAWTLQQAVWAGVMSCWHLWSRQPLGCTGAFHISALCCYSHQLTFTCTTINDLLWWSKMEPLNAQRCTHQSCNMEQWSQWSHIRPQNNRTNGPPDTACIIHNW
jgi:hypothetical protein